MVWKQCKKCIFEWFIKLIDLELEDLFTLKHLLFVVVNFLLGFKIFMRDDNDNDKREVWIFVGFVFNWLLLFGLD